MICGNGQKFVILWNRQKFNKQQQSINTHWHMELNQMLVNYETALIFCSVLSWVNGEFIETTNIEKEMIENSTSNDYRVSKFEELLTHHETFCGSFR
jgi:hypothetical protein